MKKSNKKKDSFVMYRSFYESTKRFDYETLGKFYQGLCEYALDQKEPQFENPMLEAIFVLIQPNIDANYKKWINSFKGGAPKKNQNAKKKESEREIA